MELVHKEKMRSIKQSLNSLQFFILALNVSLFSKQCGNVHTPWHSLTSALQLMLLLKKKVSSYAFSLSSCSKLPSCAVCFFFLCLFYPHKALTGILWIRKGGWLCFKKKIKNSCSFWKVPYCQYYSKCLQITYILMHPRS